MQNRELIDHIDVLVNRLAELEVSRRSMETSGVQRLMRVCIRVFLLQMKSRNSCHILNASRFFPSFQIPFYSISCELQANNWARHFLESTVWYNSDWCQFFELCRDIAQMSVWPNRLGYRLSRKTALVWFQGQTKLTQASIPSSS